MAKPPLPNPLVCCDHRIFNCLQKQKYKAVYMNIYLIKMYLLNYPAKNSPRPIQNGAVSGKLWYKACFFKTQFATPKLPNPEVAMQHLIPSRQITLKIHPPRRKALPSRILTSIQQFIRFLHCRFGEGQSVSQKMEAP